MQTGLTGDYLGAGEVGAACGAEGSKMRADAMKKRSQRRKHQQC